MPPIAEYDLGPDGLVQCPCGLQVLRDRMPRGLESVAQPGPLLRRLNAQSPAILPDSAYVFEDCSQSHHQKVTLRSAYRTNGLAQREKPSHYGRFEDRSATEG